MTRTSHLIVLISTAVIACSYPTEEETALIADVFSANATDPLIAEVLSAGLEGESVYVSFESAPLPTLEVSSSNAMDQADSLWNTLLETKVSTPPGSAQISLAALFEEVGYQTTGFQWLTKNHLEQLYVAIADRFWRNLEIEVDITGDGTDSVFRLTMAPVAINSLSFTIDDVITELSPADNRFHVTLMAADVGVDVEYDVNLTDIVGGYGTQIDDVGSVPMSFSAMEVGFSFRFEDAVLAEFDKCTEYFTSIKIYPDTLCADGKSLEILSDEFEISNKKLAKHVDLNEVAEKLGPHIPIVSIDGPCSPWLDDWLAMSDLDVNWPLDFYGWYVGDIQVSEGQPPGGEPGFHKHLQVETVWDEDRDHMVWCDPCDQDSINANSDADDVCDKYDNCDLIVNPDQADKDEDGIGDACDNCPQVTEDLDELCWSTWSGETCEWLGDGIDDSCDNCPDDYNPTQKDQDGDGLGDVCDPDRDGDWLLNEDDYCPDHYDWWVLLLSYPCGDGMWIEPTMCKIEQYIYDKDDDMVGDDCDNCPDDYNPDQGDLDGDGWGNACDDDMDNDFVPNDFDNCEDVPNWTQVDIDQDDIGDACDPYENCPPEKGPLCDGWNHWFVPLLDPLACADGMSCFFALPPKVTDRLIRLLQTTDPYADPVRFGELALLTSAHGRGRNDKGLLEVLDRTARESKVLGGEPFRLVDYFRRPGVASRDLHADLNAIDNLVRRDPAGMMTSVALDWVETRSPLLRLGNGGWREVTEEALYYQRFGDQQDQWDKWDQWDSITSLP